MMLHAAGSQFFSDHPGEGTAVGFGDIVQPELLRVALVAGAERGDDGNAALPAAQDDFLSL